MSVRKVLRWECVEGGETRKTMCKHRNMTWFDLCPDYSKTQKILYKSIWKVECLQCLGLCDAHPRVIASNRFKSMRCKRCDVTWTAQHRSASWSAAVKAGCWRLDQLTSDWSWYRWWLKFYSRYGGCTKPCGIEDAANYVTTGARISAAHGTIWSMYHWAVESLGRDFFQ